MGALGKDVENQGRSVEHLDLEGFFEVALLGGRQFVIKDDGRDAFVFGKAAHVFQLAGADVVRGKAFETLAFDVDDSRAGALSEGAEFLKGLIERPCGPPALDGGPDEERTLTRPSGLVPVRSGLAAVASFAHLPPLSARPSANLGGASCVQVYEARAGSDCKSYKHRP